MVALATLLPDLANLPDLDVAGISDDSRTVHAGDVFVAIAGERSDGHDHVAQAVRGGACVVLAERAVADVGVPVIVVPALKRRRSELAGRVLGDPSRRLYCVGVTGTNGKTSVAFYLAELATALGCASGYLGTIGWGRTTALAPAPLTTASAISTQQRLAELEASGASWVAMEVSSHALDQDRVAAVNFDVAVFTNLSRDHLDYHGSFERYGAAKARLFEDVDVAVINVDDRFGAQLAESVAVETLITFGAGGNVSWRDIEFHDRGVDGRWETPWGDAAFSLPLFGEFAVANLAAVLAVLCQAGLPFEGVVERMASVAPVPGRVEFFAGAPSLVVDYAHTPDALEKVLETLRAHVRGRLICVAGCGGDRDAGKRPLMARAAELGADVVWLTSDNPRSEDPQAILDDMAAGLTGSGEVHQLADRRVAIESAVAEAGPEDLVLIAGKGHEDYQEIGGERRPFSDRELAAEIVAKQKTEGQ